MPQWNSAGQQDGLSFLSHMHAHVRMAGRLSMHAGTVAARLASDKSALGDATPRHQVLRGQCAQGAAARGVRGGGSECGMVLQ